MYRYDSVGNLASLVRIGITTEYAYNAGNQLEQISRLGQTWKYRYDANGNRIGKEGPTGQPSTLLYSGLDLLAEYDSIGTFVARYVFAGLDEPLMRIDSQGNASFMIQDGLGSVVGLASGNGGLTDTYAYDVWGVLTARTGETVQPFGFTGREDDGTGLYNFRARYYEPALGKFTQSDPIKFAGKDYNLLRYGFNNPKNFTDPLGLWGLNVDLYPIPILGPLAAGGGITIGQNPDGGPFVVIRGGMGIGGGISFDPGATSPGFSENDEGGPTYSIGVNIGAGAAVGIPGIAISGQGGLSGGQRMPMNGQKLDEDGTYGGFYWPTSPTIGEGEFGVKAQGGVNAEFGLSLNMKPRPKCP